MISKILILALIHSNEFQKNVIFRKLKSRKGLLTHFRILVPDPIRERRKSWKIETRKSASRFPMNWITAFKNSSNTGKSAICFLLGNIFMEECRFYYLGIFSWKNVDSISIFQNFILHFEFFEVLFIFIVSSYFCW